MASKFSLPILSTLALAAAAFAAPASAAPFCPVNQSFFGTITRVDGNTLTVRTPSNHWADVRIERNARVNANGGSIRPGTYVGAYGCVTRDGLFHANELTLSANQGGYREQLNGVVRRIQSGGRLLVSQNGRGWGTWYVPDTGDFHVGQTVTATGMLGSNRAFYPQTINGRSVAYDTDRSAAPRSTITLTGTIRRVASNMLVVWQPSQRTSGTWIVPNARRFRVGQRVSARGTEDTTGRFYVQSIRVR